MAREVTATELAIIRLAYEHIGPQEICDQFMPHHTRETIKKAGHRLGLKAPMGRPPVDGRRLPPSAAEAMRRLTDAPVQDGAPSEPPPRKRRKRTPGLKHTATDEVIDYLYTQGLTVSRIAAILGLHGNTVQRRLHALGTLAKRHAREQRLVALCVDDVADSGITTPDAMLAALDRIHTADLDRLA